MQSKLPEESDATRAGAASVSKQTQPEAAYDELSHRILTYEIAPNDRIVEQFWAEKLNVSRFAIRESLTRLLGEGLVSQGERGGFFVTELSDEEIHEIREVREMIETTAIRLACERATPAQIQGLAETCDDFTNFVKKNYLTVAHEADLRFHKFLVAASGNQRLVQLYARSHIPLFHRRTSQKGNHLEEFIATDKEHRLILHALQARDSESAVQHLKMHFNRGERDALRSTSRPTPKS